MPKLLCSKKVKKDDLIQQDTRLRRRCWHALQSLDTLSQEHLRVRNANDSTAIFDRALMQPVRFRLWLHKVNTQDLQNVRKGWDEYFGR